MSEHTDKKVTFLQRIVDYCVCVCGGGCFLGRRWDEGWDTVSGDAGGAGIQDIKG